MICNIFLLAGDFLLIAYLLTDFEKLWCFIGLSGPFDQISHLKNSKRKRVLKSYDWLKSYIDFKGFLVSGWIFHTVGVARRVFVTKGATQFIFQTLSDFSLIYRLLVKSEST